MRPRPFSSCALLLFVCLLASLAVGANASAAPQAGAAASLSVCRETSDFYQQHNFVVAEIRVRPLLKFMPAGKALADALAAASANLADAGLKTGDVFNQAKLSRLNNELMLEIERRLLKGRTGLAYLSPRLTHCQPTAQPPTLEVDFVLLSVARPSYLNGSFELRERATALAEEAGERVAGQKRFTHKPYVGYNRSRGVFGGEALSYATRGRFVNQLDLDLSASGSSGVADASLAGSRESETGALSFLEWRLGYQYSRVPTDILRLSEATGRAQFFGATRPLTSRKIFLRFGASLEAGNRQSDLLAAAAPSLDADLAAQSPYRALKLYLGATVARARQDWRASYGLQLGNNGRGLSVDYVKHVFDAAYRARLLPRPHRPFQFEAQASGGLIRATGGAIPVAERFFGGNVERTFLQGDAWRIRSDALIRSFPQYRFNRTGAPLGGENFVSFNLTASQTIWHRQLMPKEIERAADIRTALGGQLLNARRVLREDPLRQSPLMRQLQEKIHDLDATGNKGSSLPLPALKTELARIQSVSATLPAGQKEAIAQALAQVSAQLSDTEDAVEAATLPPATSTGLIESADNLNQFLNNAVESNAILLAVGFPDPDPDVNMPPRIVILRGGIKNLSQTLADAGLTNVARPLDDIDARLASAHANILRGMAAVNSLRAYPPAEILNLLDTLNAPAPGSARKLTELLTEILRETAPLRTSLAGELKQVPTGTTEPTVNRRRVELEETLALIGGVETYTTKAQAALSAAADFMDAKKAAVSVDPESPAIVFDQRQTEEAKFAVESIIEGFGGGIPSHLTGIAESIHTLRPALTRRGLEREWSKLAAKASALLSIQSRARERFRRLPLPAAEREANETVNYVGRVLGVFFRELNLVGLSPAVMFDAARLSPTLSGAGGFRYGIGSGLRFNLLNVDFMAGYSFNPDRRQGEGRGAFVFRMDIADLFR